VPRGLVEPGTFQFHDFVGCMLHQADAQTRMRECGVACVPRVPRPRHRPSPSRRTCKIPRSHQNLPSRSAHQNWLVTSDARPACREKPEGGSGGDILWRPGNDSLRTFGTPSPPYDASALKVGTATLFTAPTAPTPNFFAARRPCISPRTLLRFSGSAILGRSGFLGPWSPSSQPEKTI